MIYIYAGLLLHKAGKEINEENVKKVLTATGVDVDEARIKALVAALKDVDIEEAIKKAAVTAMPMAAPVAGVDTKSADESAKKEEKSEEDEKKAEESAAAGLGALFG